jgi:hypothetical protein
MVSLCSVVELQNISYWYQQYKPTYVGTRCCPILTKFGVSRHSFVKGPNIKCHEYPVGAPLINADGRTDGRTGRQTDTTKLVGSLHYLCEGA